MGGNDLLAVYGDTLAAEAALDRVTALGDTILQRLRATAGNQWRAPAGPSSVYSRRTG